MHRLGLEALRAEGLSEPVGAPLGAREDERACRFPSWRTRASNVVSALARPGTRWSMVSTVVRCAHFDPLGEPQIAARTELSMAEVHGRGEEHGLAGWRAGRRRWRAPGAQTPCRACVSASSSTNTSMPERSTVCRSMVHEAAGSGNEDIDAFAQAGDLSLSGTPRPERAHPAWAGASRRPQSWLRSGKRSSRVGARMSARGFLPVSEKR